MEKKNWVDFFDYSGAMEQSEANTWSFYSAMHKWALFNSHAVYRTWINFDGQNYDEVISKLLEVNSHLRMTTAYVDHNKNLLFRSYVSNKTAIIVEIHHSTFNIGITSLDRQDLEKLMDAALTFVKPLAPSSNSLYVLQTGRAGPEISKISSINYQLISGNYTESINQQIEHVIEDLAKSEPCGKISILSGLPGTGKTHLLRHIIAKANKEKFVIIPPELVNQLSGPGLIKSIIDFKDDEDTNINIVFILEDADQVLAPRGSDNIGSVSTLLNISDGLIGDACNIRIIATTNENHEEFDKAIMRSGRLCRHIQVNKLDPKHCLDILNRLTDNDLTLPIKNGWNKENSYVLADLYRLIRPDGIIETLEESKFGF